MIRELPLLGLQRYGFPSDSVHCISSTELTLSMYQARAQKKPGSSLEEQLAAQKKRGMQGALKDVSEENRRQREADSAAEVRNYN
jgi:hypothetical protein